MQVSKPLYIFVYILYIIVSNVLFTYICSFLQEMYQQFKRYYLKRSQMSLSIFNFLTDLGCISLHLKEEEIGIKCNELDFVIPCHRNTFNQQEKNKYQENKNKDDH